MLTLFSALLSTTTLFASPVPPSATYETARPCGDNSTIYVDTAAGRADAHWNQAGDLKIYRLPTHGYVEYDGVTATNHSDSVVYITDRCL